MRARFAVMLASLLWSSSLFAGGGNLWIVLSGNGTCRRPINSQFVPKLINAKLFEAFHRSLLAPGIVRPEDNVIYGCYEWLSPQMQVLDLQVGGSMVPLDETQLDDFVADRASSAAKIFIIGHSHAGWRAMKLAASETLARASAAPLTLISMDPVSRVTCQQLREPGCREAPRDFSQQELEFLHQRSVWLNIYHTPAAILGSGPIAAAHVNQRIRVNHVRMEDSPVSWGLVAAFVKKRFTEFTQASEERL